MLWLTAILVVGLAVFMVPSALEFVMLVTGIGTRGR